MGEYYHFTIVFVKKIGYGKVLDGGITVYAEGYGGGELDQPEQAAEEKSGGIL